MEPHREESRGEGTPTVQRSMVVGGGRGRGLEGRAVRLIGLVVLKALLAYLSPFSNKIVSIFYNIYLIVSIKCCFSILEHGLAPLANQMISFHHSQTTKNFLNRR